ncbi:GNAT family N-acetyltransferase [Photobacterium sp. ZSDE20]|uniref:GNAT family N-acetyltransferase n=1 Tax=Photobacterium pectinilyticum TaxID=2906793 RepID=A0ABT1N454_9GAMM|nr:GNAT family N-acetyltransferase [Photobacterium sp. ZSDE20]MCQ1058649.1 GNAT family N-acetyltransferase [Photobacterium sp. ZSDE20]MDD1823363.1 GNAT family N-acetyltransferase [Photobacterium sp. ZSDE20]
MEVILATTNEEIIEIAPIMQQLRPKYTLEKISDLLNQQCKAGYKLVYVKEDNNILCVAGFVTGHKLGWGAYLYIDDLVTDEALRSTGAGQYLIEWFKDYAHINQIEQIHLDSGVHRYGAHKFYLKEDFVISSHHFVCQC